MRSWIDEQVKVTAILVFTAHYRAENTRIRHPGLQNQAADRVALLFQHGGWTHGSPLP
jgi:hypothetical protein